MSGVPQAGEKWLRIGWLHREESPRQSDATQNRCRILAGCDSTSAQLQHNANLWNAESLSSNVCSQHNSWRGRRGMRGRGRYAFSCGRLIVSDGGEKRATRGEINNTYILGVSVHVHANRREQK